MGPHIVWAVVVSVLGLSGIAASIFMAVRERRWIQVAALRGEMRDLEASFTKALAAVVEKSDNLQNRLGKVEVGGAFKR